MSANNRLLVLVVMLAIAAALAACGVERAGVVARTHMITVEAGGTETVDVLDGMQTTETAMLDAVDRPDSGLVGLTFEPDGMVTVTADEAGVGQEFVVDYAVSAGPVSDSGALIIRVVGGEVSPPDSVGLVADTGAISFGDLDVDETSPTRSIAFTNTGADAIDVTVADPVAPFTMSGEPCGILQPDETCTISVSVSTRSAGQVSGTLTATGRMSDGRVVESQVTLSAVVLDGLAERVGLTADPAVIDLGQIDLAKIAPSSSAPSGTTVITNTGDLPLSIEVSRPAAPFEMSANTCDQLRPGATCRITVIGSTNSAGDAKDELVITGTATDDRRATVTVPLRISVTQTPTIDFTLGPDVVRLTTAAPQTKVVITNTGTLPLDDLGLPDPNANYRVQNGTCGGGAVSPFPDPLPTGASCSFTLTLTDQAVTIETVTKEAVRVTGAGLARSVTLEIDATPPPRPAIDLKPGSVGFFLGNPEFVSITNSGNVDLTGLSLGTYRLISDDDGDVVLETSQCPDTLPVGQSCQIGLVFVGPNAAFSTGTVEIRFGKAAATLDVSFTTLR